MQTPYNLDNLLHASVAMLIVVATMMLGVGETASC